MNKNNWPAAWLSVTAEYRVRIRKQFRTSRLSVSKTVILDWVRDPKSVLLLGVAWQKQKQVTACDKVLNSVLTFIFWVFWSSFSCLWTHNKSCQKKNQANK